MRETTTILLILISMTVLATEQTPDNLIYRSDTIYIDTYPLGKLLETDSIVRNLIFGYSEELCISSACWRGYVATWIIENDSLFLIGLISGCEDYKFKLEDVFGTEKVRNNKVHARWFTGELTVEPKRNSSNIVNGVIKYE